MSDILIVDDEKDIRELISEILIDEGFPTRLASNSAECLKEVSNAPPGLLILDIWLKDSNMDGIDILKKVMFENFWDEMIRPLLLVNLERKLPPILKSNFRRESP